jgi:hypothetical protein
LPQSLRRLVKICDMTCRHLGKLESTVQTQVSKFASSVLAAYALFSSMALSAEMSPPPDTIPKPSDGTQASVPRRLSDAQMEALMKEIGIPYHRSTETSPRPEAPLPQPTVTPSDAQTQALLRARPEIIESTSDRVNIEFTTVFSYHIWWS